VREIREFTFIRLPRADEMEELHSCFEPLLAISIETIIKSKQRDLR